MQSAPTDPWNSLEVAKLIVAALTPVAVFIFALVARRAAIGVEKAQWMNQKLLERRLDIYDGLAPRLHEYFRRVNNNRVGLVDIAGIRALREDFDQTRHLFSEEVGRAFDSYADCVTLHFEAVVERSNDQRIERFRLNALEADRKLLETLHSDVGWPRHERRIGYRPQNLAPD